MSANPRASVSEKMVKFAAYSFIALIIYTVLSANFKWYNPFIKLGNSLPWGDKISHFMLLGGLTFFVNYLLKFRITNLWRRSILVGSLWIAIFFTLEEFSQIWIPKRTFDLLDLSSNYLGIALVTWLIQRKHS